MATVDVVHAQAAQATEYDHSSTGSPAVTYRVHCLGAGACQVTSATAAGGDPTVLANLTVGQAGVVRKPAGGNLRIQAAATYTVVTIEWLG
jgi:hypothetical protein